ncbi:hypothetical protein EV424DRAFT_1352461 [Suillus variegatus]|nr:hypothetical protein EV424DRAFT_1352461 [Suillus variegatus]
MISNAPADPPVGSKSKPKAKPMQKKTLKVVASSDSDGIEIIDHVVATTDIGPDNRRGKGKQTAPPDNVDGDTLVEVVKADTIIVRQRPMPKSTYYSDLSPYNTRERTCIISHMIRASGPWAHDKNILDYDGWAGRQIIPDGDGWAEVVGYYADGCIKVDVYEIDG